jgi:hypothetical protein
MEDSMGLFSKLIDGNRPEIDWEMTPDYTFGTYESWGGVERVRSKNERVYYFFIDDWGDEPKLCLMERGIKHARIVAEILAPKDMLQQCISEQGKVALFERTHPINEQIKQWLITNVIEGDDGSTIVPLNVSTDRGVGSTGLPTRDDPVVVDKYVDLPDKMEEMSEEDVAALVLQYNFADQERNPGGQFVNTLVDNEDGLTVTDKSTGLMWQRGGIDIMSHRSIRKEIEKLNASQFAGYSDWRLPTMAEALSLLEQEKSEQDQHIHRCFSIEQPFIFVDAVRKPGGHWFVDFKQGRAYWSSGTIPGGFGRLCRSIK